MDEEAIRGWKKEYGQVYSVEVRGVEYVFRQLTYDEFEGPRRSGASTAEAEEEFVAAALLQPEVLPDNCPAGVVTAIADTLMDVSGFGNPRRMREVLAQQREIATGNVWTMMKAVVLATQPGYVEEDLDPLTFDQLAAKVALGEQVMRMQQLAIGMEPPADFALVHILDPEEEAMKEAAAKQQHAAAKKPGVAGYDDPIAARLHDALR